MGNQIPRCEDTGVTCIIQSQNLNHEKTIFTIYHSIEQISALVYHLL